MSYIVKTNIARRENYGGSRSTGYIKYIVVHYTANDGDHDESNANYFHNNVVKASAHYFVDDDSVTISVPDAYIAWSVGGSKWNDCAKTGGGKLYKIVTNNNSLNIEMCDTKKDGKIMASEATINNTVELIKKLMKSYNIDIDHVVRHFDVNGKHCPAYYMDDTEWRKFKNRLIENQTVPETPANDSNPIHFSPYVCKVSISDLNIRKGPGTNFDKNGKIAPGAYTIIDEQPGKGSKLGWGKLKSGVGWISLDYVKKV